MLAGGESLGKTLIFLGIFLVIVGVLLHFGGKLISFGKLPGDIHIQRENFTFYFPVVTSILLSVILTILLNLFMRR